MDQVSQNGAELTEQPSRCRFRATFRRVLPQRLVKYRHLRGMSQTALAKAAGIARSTLNAIESGQATDIKLTTLEPVCHALGVSTDALLGYDSTPLVRSPQLRAIEDPEKSVDRTCCACKKQIAARELHLPGECMMELSNSGASDRRIGIAFGLPTPAVTVILREEHAARRRMIF